MKCLVSCVTKEPKLRPTMQCQVGPFRSSNWEVLVASFYIACESRRVEVWTYGLLDELRDVLMRGQPCLLGIGANSKIRRGNVGMDSPFRL